MYRNCLRSLESADFAKLCQYGTFQWCIRDLYEWCVRGLLYEKNKIRKYFCRFEIDVYQLKFKYVREKEREKLINEEK